MAVTFTKSIKVKRSLSGAILLVCSVIFINCSSYRQEEVAFQNGDTTLRGSLYVPTGQSPHPAIVFVHGSGRSTRENFRFFADLFARRGVAVLIYDKRDTCAVGSTELVSGADLAGDVLAAVAMLKARPEIDPKRIGLWGGSQGAGVAARAAAASPGDIAFFIGVSGGGVTYEELSVYQNSNRLRTRGFSEEDIREAEFAVRSLYEYVRTRKNPEEARAALTRAWEKPWASVVLPTRRLPTEEEMATWI